MRGRQTERDKRHREREEDIEIDMRKRRGVKEKTERDIGKVWKCRLETGREGRERKRAGEGRK